MSKKTISATDKLSFIITKDGTGITVIERAFKGIIRVHTLVENEHSDYDEIVNGLVGSGSEGKPGKGWKETAQKYDLPIYHGKC